MSTISKLNPQVRRARTDRRALITGLHHEHLNSAGLWLLKRLELIRRNPRHGGRWKQEMFDDACNRFYAAVRNPAIVHAVATPAIAAARA